VEESAMKNELSLSLGQQADRRQQVAACQLLARHQANQRCSRNALPCSLDNGSSLL
jgi:hypothetical protein